MTEDEEWQELERKQQQQELQKQAYDRACEVMRDLNNAEISQMTLLRAFAMGYRDAVMRNKNAEHKS